MLVYHRTNTDTLKKDAGLLKLGSIDVVSYSLFTSCSELVKY